MIRHRGGRENRRGSIEGETKSDTTPGTADINMFDIKAINPAYLKGFNPVSKMKCYDKFTIGRLKDSFMDGNVSLVIYQTSALFIFLHREK